MIYETKLDNPAAITVDVGLEVFLKGKETPIFPVVTLCFDKTHLNQDNLVESFMAIVVTTIMEGYDKATQPVFFLSDSKYNKLMLYKDEVQAIFVTAPTDSLMRALEN